MLRSTAFSTVLFCLYISPLPLLALQLAVPTRSSNGKTIFLSWTEGTGDPETIYLQIDYGFGILIPHDRLMAQVSSHSVSFEDDPKIITSTSWADLRLSAFDDPMSGSPIGQSDTFKTLQVAQPPPTPPVVTTSSTPPESIPPKSIPPKLIPPESIPPEPMPTKPKPGGPSFSESASATAMLTALSSSATSPPAESSSVGSGASNPTTSEVPGNETPPGTNIFNPTARLSPTVIGTVPPATSPRSTSPSALIGGVLGGVAFLGLCLGLSFLYRKARRVYVPTGPASVEDKSTLKGSIYMKIKKSAQAVVSGLSVPIFSHPHRDNARDSTAAKPLPYNENYRHPPESKRERLHQVQREMEEAQRLRADFQSDLERRNSRDASDNITDNGFESDGGIEGLRQQIAEMSGMIAALRVEMRRVAEEQAPPDYISMI